jgi:enoyl-CoA hydratase/carnithine racemase
MANKPANADLAFSMGLVHQVFPDASFEAEVMDFCQHLARQNGEQMGAAKIAIEMAHEVGRDTARHIERMANSALMLNPEYQQGLEKYLGSVGGKRTPPPR